MKITLSHSSSKLTICQVTSQSKKSNKKIKNKIMSAFVLRELRFKFTLISSANCLSRYGLSGRDIKPPFDE